MQRDPKPIETTYKGCRFRSRLEARWAVFFDSLSVPWEYEKQGFDLGDGIAYLPDFWLPHQECWVEVKPDRDYNGEPLERLAAATGQCVYVFFGEIPHVQGRHLVCENDSAHVFFGEDRFDLSHWWCECGRCREVGIEFEGKADRLPCGHGDSALVRGGATTPRLRAAYKAARSARFEHGERGL